MMHFNHNLFASPNTSPTHDKYKLECQLREEMENLTQKQQLDLLTQRVMEKTNCNKFRFDTIMQDYCASVKEKGYSCEKETIDFFIGILVGKYDHPI